MYDAFCHSGNVGTLGTFGFWDGIGYFLDVLFVVGLLAGLALLVVAVVRRGGFSLNAVRTGGQPGGSQGLQAQYARGEVSREQYLRRNQESGSKRETQDVKGETR